MVGAGQKGRISMLARVAVVNHHGHILLESMVAPTMPVTDYRTRFSGIRKWNLVGGTCAGRLFFIHAYVHVSVGHINYYCRICGMD